MLDHIIHELNFGRKPMPSVFDCEPPPADTVPAAPSGPPPALLYSVGSRKQRAVPPAPETAWARLIRLGEQARDANGVQVQVGDAYYTRFRVSSQRRDAAGAPLGWYHVIVTAAGVQCTCQAVGACAHIGALYLWLQGAAAVPAGDADQEWYAASTAERVRYQHLQGRVNARNLPDGSGTPAPPPPPPERVAALTADLYGAA